MTTTRGVTIFRTVSLPLLCLPACGDLSVSARAVRTRKSGLCSMIPIPSSGTSWSVSEAWFAVDTCSYVSVEACGTFSVFFYVDVDLGSEVDSSMRCSLGNLDINLRAPLCWQLAARCLDRLRSIGFLGDDFRNLLLFSAFLAWFDSGYMYMRQCRWSPTTVPRAPCIRQSPVRCLRRFKKLWIYWEMTSGRCFHSAPLSRCGYMFMCPSTRPFLYFTHSLREDGDDFRKMFSFSAFLCTRQSTELY